MPALVHGPAGCRKADQVPTRTRCRCDRQVLPASSGNSLGDQLVAVRSAGGHGDDDIDLRKSRAHLAPMRQRITIDPEVCGGRPIVAGTRMRVSDVLDALAAGASADELLEDFPYLEREDVLACLAYAARAVDHSVVQAA